MNIQAAPSGVIDGAGVDAAIIRTRGGYALRSLIVIVVAWIALTDERKCRNDAARGQSMGRGKALASCSRLSKVCATASTLATASTERTAHTESEAHMVTSSRQKAGAVIKVKRTAAEERKEFLVAFGRRLVALREGYRQDEVAEAAGISKGALSMYERGTASIPFVVAITLVETLKAGNPQANRKVTLDGLAMLAAADVRGLR